MCMSRRSRNRRGMGRGGGGAAVRIPLCRGGGGVAWMKAGKVDGAIDVGRGVIGCVKDGGNVSAPAT